jgi:hypothetical protein
MASLVNQSPSYLEPAQLYNTSQASDDQLAGPYIVYDVQTRYLYDSGQLQLPLAYDPSAASADVTAPCASQFPSRAASVNIQVSQPWGTKTVTFRVVRIGVQPMLPSPCAGNPNEILALADVRPMAPRLRPDGLSYEYEVSGIYVYNLVRPYFVSDGLIGGATPDNASTLAGNSIPLQNYSTDIA